MSNRCKVKTIRHPATVERYTIWDNLARHEEELKAVGATEADLAPLREAAKAVDAVETQVAKEQGNNPNLDKGTLTDLTAPYICANGWIVQPPSMEARRWAGAAVIKITGGQEPNDAVGMSYCILAGLFVLRAWGQGRLDEVMRLVTAPGELASLLPKLEDEAGRDPLALARDYSVLMGYPLQPSKKNCPWQVHQYRRILEKLRSRFSANATSASSTSSTGPGAPSASTGTPSAHSRPDSSRPSSGNTTGSLRPRSAPPGASPSRSPARPNSTSSAWNTSRPTP